jgi:crotonobetainyl-CoA:carnitine CoA-transferase CaiB-like acyl-CoA transferase
MQHSLFLQAVGVDFESAKKCHRRIVYRSISGHGQYGPYSVRPSIHHVGGGHSSYFLTLIEWMRII